MPDAPPAAPGLRIGVDVNPLRPPYTGVGNYELWLLDALVRRDAGIAFRGFGRSGWTAVDAAFLAGRMDAGRKSEAGHGPSPARLRPSPLRRLAAAAERAARGSTLARRAIAGLRGAAYARSVGGERIEAFHAFMYRAPARVDSVPVIPVVYDLSHVRHPEFHPAARVRWMDAVADACRRAPLVHTISDFTAGEIEAVWGVPRARIHVVPPAVSDVFRDPAAALVDGLTTREIADAFGVSIETVRHHLKSIFAKTDTHRQAELVSLLVASPSWSSEPSAD
ncbi:MAG: hypothetical protein J0H24_24155, partial [Delftia acidovorans]|nr:hypothetical protein [Delftia acidovorans]